MKILLMFVAEERVNIACVRSSGDMDGCGHGYVEIPRTERDRETESRTDGVAEVWLVSRATRPRDGDAISRDVYGGGTSTDFFCSQ